MSRPALVEHAAVDAALEGSAFHREGDELTCERELGSFAEALGYVVAVGAIAERMDHHPDIDIRWRRVLLRVSTHEAGGLTQRDLDLAAAIDRL